VSSPVWFVTGCGRGVGRSLATLLAASGGRGVVTARSPGSLADIEGLDGSGLLTAQLDVRSPESVTSAIDVAIERFGRIDVLVNNAALGVLGAVEEVTDDEIDLVLQTNLYGPLRVTRAALPHLREQGSGHIIALSSVAGFRGAPGLGIYAASKFGLEGLMESLEAEVAPLGIKVSLVEPGRIATRMRTADSTVRTKRVISAYAPTSGQTRAAMDAPQKGSAIPPEEVAARIVELAGLEDPPFGCRWETACCAYGRRSRA
jgi:NAD(P)-dependent dehydrogenase (short-subunit alcohol dehydrogenase family)